MAVISTEHNGRRRQGYHQPHSVDDLTERNVALVADLDEAAKAKRTPTDRAVDAITAFCGTMTFVWVHVCWFAAWMTYNVLPVIPKQARFDPYPYPLLLMIVNLEAIFLTTFILISQNRQGRLAERRSHLDLQINLLSEQENTKMLAMLDAIHRRLGIAGEEDPEISVLKEGTEPDRLVQQIEQVIEHEETRGAGRNGAAPRKGTP